MDAGRLGNVTAALLLEGREKPAPEELERVAVLLDGIFEELLLVGGEPGSRSPGRRVATSEASSSALASLSDALEAASCPRVLVVPGDRPTPDVELWLALTAWPEQAALVACGDEEDRPLAALYRSEDVLPGLRRELARDRGELSALLGRIEVERVTLATLGIDARDRGGRVSGLGAPAPRDVVSEGC